MRAEEEEEWAVHMALLGIPSQCCDVYDELFVGASHDAEYLGMCIACSKKKNSGSSQKQTKPLFTPPPPTHTHSTLHLT